MRLLAGGIAIVMALACGRPASRPAAEPAAASGTASAASATPATAPSAASATPANAPSTAAATSQAGEGWTTTAVDRKRPGPPALLTAVRAGAHAGFDRVAFDFAGQLPGYRVELASAPVHACGTGDPVELPGAAVLVVALRGAAAHDDLGHATVADRDRRPGLPGLLQLKLFCDFEGDVSWALALPRPARFRVRESAAPPRLLVDIEHPN